MSVIAPGPTEVLIRGHAARFNSLSDDLGGFRETIEPGAFGRVLRSNPDTRLLWNHDRNFVLARVSAGTLRLCEDAQGLNTEASVELGINWVSDLRQSMLRRDVREASFAFTLDPEGGDEWAIDSQDRVIRTIKRDGIKELFDVSVVTYPAYPAADLGVRGERRSSGSFAVQPRRGSAPRTSSLNVEREWRRRRRELALRRAQTTMTPSPCSSAPAGDALLRFCRGGRAKPGKGLEPVQVATQLRVLWSATGRPNTSATVSKILGRLEEAGLHIA